MNITVSYILKSPKNNFEDFYIEPQVVKDFFVVEDLESPFCSAQLEIIDLGGWFESFPITGNEEFEIELLQEGDHESSSDASTQIRKILRFEIFKIKSDILQNKNGNVYTFTLVEKGFFNYSGRYFSKSYKDKKINEIMTDILQNQLAFDKDNIKYEVEETRIKMDFIIPFWKSSTTIKYLTSIASRIKNPNESGYLFFSSFGPPTDIETTKRFVSIATLLEQKADIADYQKFYLRDQSRPSTYINNILEMNNLSLINKQVLKTGIKGKTYFGINLYGDKKIIKETKSITKFIEESVFLGEKTHFEKDIDDVFSDVQFVGLSSSDLIKNKMNRNFRLNFEQLNKREIYCAGLLDRYVGRIIHISEKSGNTEDVQNILYSGSWLIKKIVHLFGSGTGKFSQKMTIIKNSFGELEDGAAKISHIETKKRNL